MRRREFMSSASAVTCAALFAPLSLHGREREGTLVSVSGSLMPSEAGLTLIHEHILVDFIGAAETGPHRYDADEVSRTVLPYLIKAKEAGCDTFVECTPAYLGRDVKILQRLADATGLNIISNTGYYGAAEGKFLPTHVHEEDAQLLAAHWIDEWRNGIEGTGIYPGFIKTGVDKGPLTPVSRKLLTAAAIAHLETGLSISAHTGDGVAALEELEILEEHGVDADAFRWVHAQLEKDKNIHLSAAQSGAWIEFDGISPENITEHVELVKFMKQNGLLHRTLISQDSGWYHVGEAGGGDFRPYTTIFESFVPVLKSEGFGDREIDQVLVDNPRESLAIEVRKAEE